MNGGTRGPAAELAVSGLSEILVQQANDTGRCNGQHGDGSRHGVGV
jgi:hypothetical protein